MIPKPKRVRAVTLRPGDTVVIEYDALLSQQQRAIVARDAIKAFGEDVRVVILDGGVRVRVVRPKV